MASISRHSAVLRQAVRHEPGLEEVAAIARKAAQYASSGQHEQALSCYREVLLLDDSRPELWFNYASLQRAMGLPAEAAESFEFALRIRPELYAARYCLAKVLFELGQPLAAKAHYQEIVRHNPGYVPAWRNLGQLHHALGDLDNAQSCLEQAILRSPNDEELRRMLAAMQQDGPHDAQN